VFNGNNKGVKAPIFLTNFLKLAMCFEFELKRSIKSRGKNLVEQAGGHY